MFGLGGVGKNGEREDEAGVVAARFERARFYERRGKDRENGKERQRDGSFRRVSKRSAHAGRRANVRGRFHRRQRS